MVYNADLGYDPEEWEECPHKEQIILFSFFTRLLLSSAAVAFVAYFFWMIDGHKHKDGKQEELNQQPTDTIITEVSRRLEELADSRKEKKSAPSETAEDLLREADDYMKDIRPLPQNFAQFVEKPCQRAHEALQEGSPFAERFVDDDRELAWKQQQIAVGLGTFGQPHGKVITESRRKISKEDEQALRQWELEREMLEAERLAKLQDHEAGGDESDRTSGLLPASHISMPSRSTQDGEDSFGRGFDQDNHPFNGLERKLLTEIGQIAQSTPTLKQDRNQQKKAPHIDGTTLVVSKLLLFIIDLTVYFLWLASHDFDVIVCRTI
ncbi:hypothetical protein DICVIV_01812 [Dictyocaulus viviparus]|uniref:Uncharacterized protein n=1 Tax=Dictyocaulus viviparus TaxID=29172 RepID=A0A0D8YBQ5_DICVI|nr:hypothetical protein DICVIV_01812 [Dictyocaulus viviparus]